MINNVFMKGIILAGDSGDRLHPLSLGIPKQLIPVYDKPMIYYPIETLAKLGIADLMVITSPKQLAAFQESLGDGNKFNVQITYAVQQEPEGIAQAIMIADEFIAQDDVCLVTGDTLIFGLPFYPQLDKAMKAASKSANATIFVAENVDGEQYGRVILGKTQENRKLIGNGKNTFDELYISGIYVYPNNVKSKVRSVQLSERNRYEILDVNRMYLKEDKLQIQMIDSRCVWLDTNTPENILKCSLYVCSHQNEI